ncbi:MAG: non-canonical purine NTP pyrophosphatase [Gemmatimonadetes bacterium]|nr:non-canonical purine NTP pyrophosphatase [Gemmatimonadota bacterium]
MTVTPRVWARVVLATRNPGKARELHALFASIGVTLEDLDAAGLGAVDAAGLGAVDAAEETLESYPTFEENARAKARWFAARLPGCLVIADDSGLEVDALGGAPGVHSKRWSGSTVAGAALEAANNVALQRALEGKATRSARYVSVVVATDGTREYVARGECRGRILDAAEGTNGFGYDPFFFSDDLGESFGAASREEKSAVSHRGRAFRALVEQLVA